MKQILFTISIFYIFININCDNVFNSTKQKDTVETIENILWPMQVGNYWEYDKYYMNSMHFQVDSSWGAINDSSNFVFIDDTIWYYKNFTSFNIINDISLSEPINFKTEIKKELHLTYKNNIYPCKIFYNGFEYPFFSNKTGIYNFGIIADKDSILQKKIYIPFDVKIDSSWYGNFFYRFNEKLYCESVIDRKCISKSEFIFTPLGKFKCYVIYTRIERPDDIIGYYDYYEYFAPNIGIVCYLKMYIVPNQCWSIEYFYLLKKYSINN